MKFVTLVRHRYRMDYLAVAGRFRIDVDDAETVGLREIGAQHEHVRKSLGRSLHRQLRCGVESRIKSSGHVSSPVCLFPLSLVGALRSYFWPEKVLPCMGRRFRQMRTDGSHCASISVDPAPAESGLAATFPTKPIATTTPESAAPARRKFERETTAFGFRKENPIIMRIPKVWTLE